MQVLVHASPRLVGLAVFEGFKYLGVLSAHIFMRTREVLNLGEQLSHENPDLLV
jgi:hypothetical protein